MERKFYFNFIYLRNKYKEYIKGILFIPCFEPCACITYFKMLDASGSEEF